MTEYEKQAKDFLRSCGARMTITETDIVDRFPNDSNGPTGSRWKYRVTIRRDGRRWSFNFYGSIHDFQTGKKPTAYDVLACIQKQDPEDFNTFCLEYGYNDAPLGRYAQVKRIYNAVQKEYKNVVRMFGDVMDQLQELN